ncbi:MAG: aminopeptidase N [Bacteriovoracaceae bacterium]|nr:aminopeptidase N [Bacteriovoracaceae bacterium]
MTNKTVYAKEYQVLPYLCTNIDLVFDLYEEKTLVENWMTFELKSESDFFPELVLNGEDLKLLDWSYLNLDRKPIEREWAPTINETHFSLVPDRRQFILYFKTEIYPQENKTYSGLYKSGKIFSTQNEAEGFRKISYSYDRPDSLSLFSVKISADKKLYPVLLANGHLVDQGEVTKAKHRHYVYWKDPFVKPTYLMAMVAGDLSVKQDEFVTKSGRKILCEIYVVAEHIDQVEHAMDSLKRAMKWDEDRFNLEYDLDRYMIVAVPSFNGGAMENKGLNIFNTKYVLGAKETSTDDQLYRIESVIGHEYFHNWTGNRVTPKDWFQLTLKEGLTVYRDQEFSSDLHSRPIKRIEDIKLMRERQFAEDAGPFAHSIRPSSYQEINNFYTLTVYEKGAEFFRMLETILGKRDFKFALQDFLKKFDGKSAQLEDFFDCCLQHSWTDLSLFWKWSEQVGTKKIKVTKMHNSQFIFEQIKEDRDPVDLLCIPIRMSFFNPTGAKIKFELSQIKIVDGEKSKSKWKFWENDAHEILFLFSDKQAVLEISGLKDDDIMSLNRHFSSPIKIEMEETIEQGRVLSQYDDDSVNQWLSVQKIYEQILKSDDRARNSDLSFVKEWLIHRPGFKSDKIDFSLIAELLSLPAESSLIQHDEIFNFELTSQRRCQVISRIAKENETTIVSLYEYLKAATSREWNQSNMDKRSLKNVLLDYLLALDSKQYSHFCAHQITYGDQMTDIVSALMMANRYQINRVEDFNGHFLSKYRQFPTLKDLWFQAQMLPLNSQYPLLEKLKTLLKSDDFSILNPNHVYSLIGQYQNNLTHFHHESGQGYSFISEIIGEVDKSNPQVAARLAKNFPSLSRLNLNLRQKLRSSLFPLLQKTQLSKDVREIIEKCLSRD